MRHSEPRVAALLVVSVLVHACTGVGFNGYERMSEARHQADALRTQFAAAVDAANQAVMADSSDAARRSAGEAGSAREAIKRTEHELSALLREFDYDEESKLLKDFHDKFLAYEVLDRSILELALEKTNAKATQLAYGAGRDAAQTFKGALSKLARETAGGDAWRVRALAAEAIAALGDVQVLEPPHIAEASDDGMTSMEEKMQAATERAHAALGELASLQGRDAMAPADAALARFLETHAQIVALSRRNSEVRSRALTLGQKRTLIASCEESLQTLAATLTKRLYKPTR